MGSMRWLDSGDTKVTEDGITDQTIYDRGCDNGENKSMLKPLLIALIFFTAAPIVSAQQRPSSLIQKRVTFTLPTQWEIQKQEDSDTVGKIQILIPYPETDKTPH